MHSGLYDVLLVTNEAPRIAVFEGNGENEYAGLYKLIKSSLWIDTDHSRLYNTSRE